jgi:hypothetical protein
MATSTIAPQVQSGVEFGQLTTSQYLRIRWQDHLTSVNIRPSHLLNAVVNRLFGTPAAPGLLVKVFLK